MNDLLNDYHNWKVLCYEKFFSPKYDMFDNRYITVGYVIFHRVDGTIIYASERSWRDLRNILTIDSYNELDYCKIMYQLKKSYYSAGSFSLKPSGIQKDWVEKLFESSRFQSMYAKYAPADMNFYSMRNLLNDYANNRMVLGAIQMQQVYTFLDEVLFPIFVEEEQRKCIFYKSTFIINFLR